MTQHRITPACAGKSFCVICICHNNQDHPRVCGEKEEIVNGLARR